MSAASDRSARLFYDDTCGACRLFARAAEGASRRQLVAIPLSNPDADTELNALPTEVRNGFAHLMRDGQLRTGEALASPLVRLIVGPRLGRALGRVPFVDRSLRGVYRRLWEFRRSHGCGGRAAR